MERGKASFLLSVSLFTISTGKTTDTNLFSDFPWHNLMTLPAMTLISFGRFLFALVLALCIVLW